jgi:hypothetical protein
MEEYVYVFPWGLKIIGNRSVSRASCLLVFHVPASSNPSAASSAAI